jgi:phosphoglycerate dehydrogenase-like enzyme
MAIKVGIKSSISQLGNVIKSDCSKISILNDLILNQQLVFEDLTRNDSNCEILIADPGLVSTTIDTSFNNLKWMQCTFAGVNRMIDDSRRDNFILTRIGEGFGSQMTEYVLGWILSLQLKIPTAFQQKEKREWNPSPYMSRGTLQEKTIGILGTGQIGSAVAQGCKGFGMKTIGYCTNPNRYTSSSSPFDLYTDSLETLLTNSHILVNTLPSTPTTRYLLTYSLLSSLLSPPSPQSSHPDSSQSDHSLPHLSPGAITFINIGRGDVISSSDIMQLLSEGFLEAVVLDVFESEPLPSDHPLYSAKGVYLTPHISALSTSQIVSQNFIKNLLKYLEYSPSQSSAHQEGQQQFLREHLYHVVERRRGY